MTSKILDHPGIQQVLFHPRPDYGTTPAGVHPLTVETEPGITLAGRLYPAAPDAPVILYYHGNGEIAADYDDLSAAYTRLGITLLVMDYRGYGGSSGTPSAASLLTDAAATLPQLPDIFAAHKIAPSHLFVMGRSLGSAPAIELAHRFPAEITGLIIESGFADTFGLIDRLGVSVHAADEQRDGFGSAFKLAETTLPVLIIHGTRDIIIPAQDAETLYQQSSSPEIKKRLVLIPGAGHNDLMVLGHQTYFDAIRSFVFHQWSTV